MRALLRAPAVRVAFLSRLVAHSSSISILMLGTAAGLTLIESVQKNQDWTRYVAHQPDLRGFEGSQKR